MGRSRRDIGRSRGRDMGAGLWLAIIFITLCLVMAFTSCTRKVYLPVEKTVYRTDTLRTTTQRTDSIFVHDSISYVQKGDTVLIEKFRDRFRYINLSDTVYQSKTDSIRVSEPYPVEVIKEVPKPLAWWQKTLIWLGVAFFALLAFVVYRVLRKHTP